MPYRSERPDASASGGPDHDQGNGGSASRAQGIRLREHLLGAFPARAHRARETRRRPRGHGLHRNIRPVAQRHRCVATASAHPRARLPSALAECAFPVGVASVAARRRRVNGRRRALPARGGLPGDAPACLDPDGQIWREMEAFGAVWLRLWIVREGRFDEARGFAARFRATAETRGPRRTLMRSLVLSDVTEERAGDRTAADAHPVEYLALFAETDDACPAVVERRWCIPALVGFLDGAGDSPLCPCAASLLVAIRRADADRTPDPSAREREILSRLEGRTDRATADEPGLTIHGVRDHLRGLICRFAARNRADALRQTREFAPCLGRWLTPPLRPVTDNCPPTDGFLLPQRRSGRRAPDGPCSVGCHRGQRIPALTSSTVNRQRRVPWRPRAGGA